MFRTTDPPALPAGPVREGPDAAGQAPDPAAKSPAGARPPRGQAAGVHKFNSGKPFGDYPQPARRGGAGPSRTL